MLFVKLLFCVELYFYLLSVAGSSSSYLSVSLQYLNLESSFEGKDYVCTRLLRFLVSMATSAGVTEKLSFQLLEALLYRVDLNIFTGRTGAALALLQVTCPQPCPIGSGLLLEGLAHLQVTALTTDLYYW